MHYAKHRDEKEIYTFDFVNRLAVGETLAIPAVKVSRRAGEQLYADKTAEFGSPAPAISGSKVTFTLHPAGQAAHQAPGDDYTVYVKVDTSQGRILVGTNGLVVSREGS